MEILHARSICETDQAPIETPGRNVNETARSVVCPDCGRAGTIASPGYVDDVREQWATRNGYALIRENNCWTVKMPWEQGGQS